MTIPFPFRLTAWLVVPLALAPARLSRAEDQAAKRGTLVVYVGSYTGGESKGISRFDFDATTGAADRPRLAAETPNPSFLAFAPSGRFLYAVNEVDSFEGERGGAVSGFAVEPGSGDLTALNHQSTGGGGPCHLVVDRAGKNVLAANYNGGSVVVLPIDADGRLKTRSALRQHTGSGPVADRQSGPRAHSINLDAANRFAFAADLGLDKVFIDRFDPEHGSLTPNDPPAATLPPGSGPRHFAFHPSGKFAYAINELNSTVSAWTYDPDQGTLADLQTISTLPVGARGANFPADLQVHPSGRFLFGSNRGHDSIVSYLIDPRTGKLVMVGHQSEGIKNPRNFAIDPGGRFVLVASQDLDRVSVFSIDPDTGALFPTGHAVKVARPVCLKFPPAAAAAAAAK